VIESVPFNIVGPGKISTVAVVDESVNSTSVLQITAGSDVEQIMFVEVALTAPVPGTKFVPVTPTVNPADPPVRLPTAVTALIVGPATIAMVPA
jgi:hypothetical protein